MKVPTILSQPNEIRDLGMNQARNSINYTMRLKGAAGTWAYQRAARAGQVFHRHSPRQLRVRLVSTDIAGFALWEVLFGLSQKHTT